MSLQGFQRVEVAGAGCRLSVLEGGNPDGDPVILVHGMRDHAAMFTFLDEHLSDHRLLLPDELLVLLLDLLHLLGQLGNDVNILTLILVLDLGHDIHGKVNVVWIFEDIDQN